MTDFSDYGPPTDDVIAQNLAAQIAHTGRRKADPPKRSGKTPEAKVSAAIDRYLKRIGAINIRTNAGSWQDEHGNFIMGAKAGTSDKTVCLRALQGHSAPFCAIEVKSAAGRQTDAQKRYQQRVESVGGLYILARSVDDVRAALVARFGAEAVKGWEG